MRPVCILYVREMFSKEEILQDAVDNALTKIEIIPVMESLIQNVLLSASDEDRVGEVSSEHAFDYDGCIGNDIGEKLTPEELVEAQADFWEYVKRVMKTETRGLPRDRRCVSIATARQSKLSDEFNTQYNDSTSCFPLYHYLPDFLDAQLDQFLLADLFSDLPTGTSFERAMDPEYLGEHADWYFDESKITLIYAKIHRSALYNQYGLVLFTFYDDRSDILDGLYHFFNTHKALLPPNLILNLCQFVKGESVQYYRPISQEGQTLLGIDYDYKRTTKVLGAYLHSLATVLNHGIPLGLQIIYNLNLANMIYRLRTEPEPEKKIRLGNMIFMPPEQALQSARDEASCSLDKMLANGVC